MLQGQQGESSLPTRVQALEKGIGKRSGCEETFLHKQLLWWEECTALVGVEAGEQPEPLAHKGPCLPFLRQDFVLKAVGRGFLC